MKKLAAEYKIKPYYYNRVSVMLLPTCEACTWLRFGGLVKKNKLRFQISPAYNGRGLIRDSHEIVWQYKTFYEQLDNSSARTFWSCVHFLTDTLKK